MVREFLKLNDEPIPIEYGLIEDVDPDGGPVPYFCFDGTIYHLDYFIRVHNSPWVHDDYPEYIHAFDSENYWNPLFIEVVFVYDEDTCVNVYSEISAVPEED